METMKGVMTGKVDMKEMEGVKGIMARGYKNLTPLKKVVSLVKREGKGKRVMWEGKGVLMDHLAGLAKGQGVRHDHLTKMQKGKKRQ
jgi:hypothetical protein